jgi:hypothetical protein
MHYFIFQASTKLDPIEYYLSVHLTNVLYWPDDDRSRSKHAATVQSIAYIIYYIDVVVY